MINLISRANYSAAALVNFLTEHFPSFRDETRFEGRQVRILKRAQIFAADLWAAFDGQGYGRFDDIDGITMFAGRLEGSEVDRCAPLNKTRRLSRPPNATHIALHLFQSAFGESHPKETRDRVRTHLGSPIARYGPATDLHSGCVYSPMKLNHELTKNLLQAAAFGVSSSSDKKSFGGIPRQR